MSKKGNNKAKGPKRPEDWPSNPQALQLLLSPLSFQQTGFRVIQGKPPFLRCLLNCEVMANNGIHADLPLLISTSSNSSKSIVAHAWPSTKINQTDCGLDDQIISYLNIQRGKKENLILTPVDQFSESDRIVLNDCPESVCKLLPAIYSGIVVGSNTAVFYGNHTYEVLLSPSHTLQDQTEKEDEQVFYRVGPRTTFVSSIVQFTSIPVSLENQYEQLNNFLKQKKSVLLSGPSGSGKTSLLNSLISKNTSLCFFSTSIPSLLSGSFGVAERTLRSSRCRSTDVVILENAEVLGTDEVSRRLVAAICDLCESCCSTVIITTTDESSFPKILRQLNRINEHVEIQAPGQVERLQILKSLLSKASIIIITNKNEISSKAVDDLQQSSNTDISQKSKASAFNQVNPSAFTQNTASRSNFTGFGGFGQNKPANFTNQNKAPNNDINKTEFSEDDVIEASKNATGFVGGDLQRLVSEAIVEGKTLTECVSRIKPASLRHITLEVPEVRWNDIGGYEIVKSKLKESVTLPLERPESFTRLGIRPPRGVLLFGPPGCSKTLMAKAVATESKMNFIAVKGPELFSKFVGESEKAVASVFKKARSAAPSIIFFDEIDAMATKRGANESTGGSNVTDRVLTQLLTEMDGVSTRFDQPVVVIAATNRPDLLDPALLRPGRFDRLVYISLPDFDARKEIFRVHILKMRFEKEILDEVKNRSSDENENATDSNSILRLAALKTNGYSGAEIAAICREAAMNALREDPPADAVSKKHLFDAIEKVKPRTPETLIKWYEMFESQRKY